MSLASPGDELLMRRALSLARRAWGQTHPNPMVGALIVEEGEVVAEGWHQQAGGPHAEIEALNALARKPATGAILYVTLEPCSTLGRTGACTDAILSAGFAKVVVGATDPNPAHAGGGLERLRAANVDVISGVLEEECRDLNLIFNHWITAQSPLIAAKMALTLDGKFAAASGHSKWVTGEDARNNVMHWRRYFPAIGVSANTVLKDDPSLTARSETQTHCPRRFVFDRNLKTLEAEHLPSLYTDCYSAMTTLVCLESASETSQKHAISLGLGLWSLPESGGQIDWNAFRLRCVEEAIYALYIETGPGLATSILEGLLADYAFIYQAPKFMSDSNSPGIGSARSTSSMLEAIELSNVKHESFGPDRLIRGFLKS